MSYSESALEKKLAELNNSQQSIQQLSLWLIHHRKHHVSIIKVWFKDILKITPAKKLTLLYLANDVVQNSKKKYPEFASEFGPIMKRVLDHLAQTSLDEKTIKSIGRLLNIWQERNIFDPKIQTDLQRIWTKKSLEAAAENLKEATTPPDEPKTPPVKKPKIETPSKSAPKPLRDSSKNGSAEKPAKPINQIESGLTPSGADPPEPEELIKALQDLENSASSDAIIREKIARLPPELSEASHLESLQSYEDGQKLLVQVNEATGLLSSYNDRLQQELQDRRRVGQMIADFLAAQKDLLTQAEERLELYRDKLDKVNTIREDLRSHIQSLPDLTKLPDVNCLAPLPSAGDLFTMK